MEIAVFEGEEDLVKDICNDFRDFPIERKDADIGGGADLWVSVLSVAVGTFLMGKNINENIDAWSEIGKKIKRIFSKEKKPMFLDREAAIALAISIISEKTEIKDIELIYSKDLNERRYNTKGFKLNFSPYDYFFLNFKVNSIEHFIFCIKSNGEIRFKDYFEASEWNYKYDWESYEKREIY